MGVPTRVTSLPRKVSRVTHASTESPSSQSIEDALGIARKLIKAGVPVFTAPPCEINCGRPSHKQGRHHYRLPLNWERAIADVAVLDLWQPGWALAAVGGGAADFLDVDPRNGGDREAAALQAAREWPRIFGRQLTPSGGYHDIITATGERKYESFVPGVDLQSGAPDGQGRGFVYIAPTLGASKVTGELVPYRWQIEPDVADLIAARGRDDTVKSIVSLIRARRTSSPPAPRLPDGPFWQPERAFTRDQAWMFVQPSIERLKAAPIGQIETRCNDAVVELSHFVPAFISVDQAMGLLRTALASTAYDESHPASTWTVEKFRPVLDGRRPVRDPWRAELIEPSSGDLNNLNNLNTQVNGPVDLVDQVMGMVLDRDGIGSIEPTQPLIKGLLNRNSESWLIAPPGGFKSFVALDIACHVATGLQWRNLKTAKGSVLYLVAEGASGVRLRIEAWEATYGARTDDLKIIPYAIQVSETGRDISPVWSALAEVIKRIEPALIVIDTQSRVTVALDENSNSGAGGMGTFIRGVQMLRDAARSCVLVVHHTGGSGDRARGATAIDGAQDTELRIVRPVGRREREKLTGTLMIDKQKDGSEAGDHPFAMTVVHLGQDGDGDPITSLALRPWNPFELEAEAAAVELPWQGANLRSNLQEVMAAMDEHSDSHGVSQTLLGQWILDRRKQANPKAKPMAKATLSTALRDLTEPKSGPAYLSKLSPRTWVLISKIEENGL